MTTTPAARDADAPLAFSDVLVLERADIAASRTHRYDPKDPHRHAVDSLVGLALSGGGIRSATFSLGLLQGLHALDALRMIDYLSTVSGGGYAGAWWTAWLHRRAAPVAPTRPRDDFPSDEALDLERAPDAPGGGTGNDPIHHVRLFSNYLTPRKGLLSADTWRAIAVVSRNLVLTWLVLVPLLCALLLIAQLYFIVQPFDPCVVDAFLQRHVACPAMPTDVLWSRALVAARPLLVPVALLVWVTILWLDFNNAGNKKARAVNLIAALVILAATVVAAYPAVSTMLFGGTPNLGNTILVLITLVIGLVIHRDIVGGRNAHDAVVSQARSSRATRWHAVLLMTTAAAAFVFVVAGFVGEWFAEGVKALARLELADVKAVTTAVGSVLGVATTVFTAFKSAPAGGRDAREMKRPSTAARVVFAIAPILALVLVAGAAAAVTHRALRTVHEGDRIVALEVASFFGLAFAIFLAAWENAHVDAGGRHVPRAYTVIAVVLLGMLTVLAWLPPVCDASDARRRLMIALAAATGALAVAMGIGLLALRTSSGRVRALLGLVVVAAIAGVGLRSCWLAIEAAGPAIVLLTTLVGWVLALGWMADPNALSLHTFYKARLVRAYLGASNPGRRSRNLDIAEPDRNDDVELSTIDVGRTGAPYHLVNATLNLVGGRDLATAQRSAANFVLAPRACGSAWTGYRRTEPYMDGKLTLGAAIATSGAAVSPNMGSATPSAALSLLLAALNIRLGLWVPTPDHASWRVPQTHLWPYYLVRESLSQTNALGTYCYLTDGGHFDNTGLYALVERGCKFIIVSDNGADPDPCFADIGEAVRRCRIDFRADITLDTRVFRPADATVRAAVHVTTGTIVYDETHVTRLGWTDVTLRNRTGRIVWIKPTLLPEDAADVRQYGLENYAFPQQTTADQWFDESQFESYRKLGELSARAAFTRAMDELPPGLLTAPAVAAAFARCERASRTGSITRALARLLRLP